MKFHARVLAATCAAASFVVTLPAGAHAIWFAERGRQTALIYGVGADDLDAVRRMPLIKSVEGFDENWVPVKASLRAAGAVPVVDSDEPLNAIAATMDNGIWSRPADGGEWIGKGKDQVPGARDSERTLKFAVYLPRPLTRPVPIIPSQVLQIVPLAASMPTELGKPITVKVLYRGKPVAGAELVNDLVNDPDQPKHITAADGTVTVRVRNQGLNVFEAVYVGPSDSPAQYDKIEYSATLSFLLPHVPE